MSQMHEVEVMFKDQQVLVDSLKGVGLECEIFDKGTAIAGKNANVVVRRDQFRGMRDIGFEKTQNGFIMHADDYDYGAHGKKINL